MAEQRTKGPDTFLEAAKAATAERMTPEEEAAAEENPDEVEMLGDSPANSPLAQKANEEPEDETAVPKWCRVPPNFRFPPYKQIGFAKFTTSMTKRPDLGDRDVIFWDLSVADEKLARAAARGGDALHELTKRMIRSIDGVKADWTGKKGPGNVDKFWDEIGGACRPLMINFYWKLHSLSGEDSATFFLKYATFRSAVVG